LLAIVPPVESTTTTGSFCAMSELDVSQSNKLTTAIFLMA